MSEATTPNVHLVPELENSQATTAEIKQQPEISPEQKQAEMIIDSFKFVELEQAQKDKQKNIYSGAQELARVICSNVKAGPMQMEAIQMLYRVVMTCNQSIQFEK